MASLPLRAAAEALVRSELGGERPFAERLLDLGARFPDLEPLLGVLREREEGARAEALLRGEASAMRRLGWKLFRPLVAISLLGAGAFLVQRSVDPGLGLPLFLGGAAAMYAAAQVLFEARRRAAERALRDCHERSRARLRSLLDASGLRE